MSVSVSPGGNKTISFTNTRFGTLVIQKTSIGGLGSFDFNIIAPNGDVGSTFINTTGSATGGTGSITIPSLVPGTYTMVEIGQTGWTGWTGATATSVAVPAGATATSVAVPAGATATSVAVPAEATATSVAVPAGATATVEFTNTQSGCR